MRDFEFIPLTRLHAIAAAEDFVPGDIVILNSGGPEMTVIDVCYECDSVEVAYGDSEGNIQFEIFPFACVFLADDED